MLDEEKLNELVSNYNVEQLVAAYRHIRDRKAEIEQEFKEKLAPLNAALSRIETETLKRMQECGAKSLQTKSGTAYQTVRVSASVADREAFRAYCEAEDAWELADIRASKAAIRAMLEETGELPPGINWRESIGVNFRR